MTIDLKSYTTIKIGQSAEVDIFSEDSYDDAHFILGNGSNIIVDLTHPKLALLDDKYDYINLERDTLTVGAKCKNTTLVDFAKAHNLSGFEFMQKIPAQVGGMVKMNAGIKDYEIFNIINRVKIGNKWVNRDDILYSYRHTDITSPIFAVEFKVREGFNTKLSDQFATMRKNQPKGATAGSCFKNPKGYYAGMLIESVGLKGLVVNNISFNIQHANFLTNHGNATFNDAVNLILEAKNRVKEKFNISLKLENIIVTNNSELLNQLRWTYQKR